jgi:anti-sigma factor RsiW
MKDLIPLYVKGLLSAEEKKKVEEAFAVCPSLLQEIEDWKKIECVYRAIETALPQPSPALYTKIRQGIAPASNPGLLQRIMPSPGISFAMLAVQFFIIITLGVTLLQQKQSYTTMSAPAVSTEDIAKINVVFNDEVTEAEIRELLLEISGRIVDGPHRSGLYIVELRSYPEAGSALEVLNTSGLVKMAEKAY